MEHLSNLFKDAFEQLFEYKGQTQEYILQSCAPEHGEDYTFVLFPWVKKLGINPQLIGDKIGTFLIENNQICSFQVVKGFFNFSVSNSFWNEQNVNFSKIPLADQIKSGQVSRKYLIEYCSPNTNKPLHLGHIRNILLGWSVHKILQASGHHVETTQVINDRGIAICKSMYAWKKWSNGATPESVGQKPDHFVGEYYVLFENKFREEYALWQSSDDGKKAYQIHRKENENETSFFSRYKNEYFNLASPIGKEVRELLVRWETGENESISLWKKMNEWVYIGFEETFKRLQVHFDHYYYESQTYLLGKDLIKSGLDKHIFQQESDGSVWINLEDCGLDKKILMRSDGTSLYITQDLGTAHMRHNKHHADSYIYVVADEQDYHFKVLFETLKRMGEPYADQLYHLSYGMVDLPEGRMKSREGNVVDADDLINDVIKEAQYTAEERGEINVLPQDEQQNIFTLIGMAALKYFILKVGPKKRMIFDPKESVDMQGHTGPYIVNAYVRIKSILRKANLGNKEFKDLEVGKPERMLLRLLYSYPDVIHVAAKQLDPSHLANYLYSLAKEFHKFYHDHRILNAESESLIQFRLVLCRNIANVIEHGMDCLGIEMPERM